MFYIAIGGVVAYKQQNELDPETWIYDLMIGLFWPLVVALIFSKVCWIFVKEPWHNIMVMLERCKRYSIVLLLSGLLF